MILFYVTEDVEVRVAYREHRRAVYPVSRAVAPSREGDCNPSESQGDERARPLYLKRHPSAGKITPGAIYIATRLEVANLTNALERSRCNARLRLLGPAVTEQICTRPGMPIRIGNVYSSGEPFGRLEEQVARLGQRHRLRIAVLNVFSPAIGDSIQCITALRELHRRLQQRFGEVGIELLQARFSGVTDAMYLRSGLVREIHVLPQPLTALTAYDAYVDLSHGVRPDIAWIDGCLEAIGVAPEAVSAAAKRNQVVVDCAVQASIGPEVERIRAAGQPLLLFHPWASTPIRSIPQAAIPGLLGGLIEQTEYTIVTTVPVPFSHERLIDWSALSRTMDDFVCLVSSVDLFLAVDTAIYHIADAFDVPGVVLFTSIEPSLRIQYYPYVSGIQICPGNRLNGLHYSEREDDVAYAETLWEHLDIGLVISALRSIAAKRHGNRDRLQAVRTAE